MSRSSTYFGVDSVAVEGRLALLNMERQHRTSLAPAPDSDDSDDNGDDPLRGPNDSELSTLPIVLRRP